VSEIEGEAKIVIDGNKLAELSMGDVVIIKKSESQTSFVVFGG
jgi:NAD kinase